MALKEHSYYFSIAKKVANRGTCNRLQIGCVLVSEEGEVLSEGHYGTPLQLGDCKEQLDLCPGRDIEGELEISNACYSVHAEIRALKDCRDLHKVFALYSTRAPCTQCILALMTTPCVHIFYRVPSTNGNLGEHLWIKSGGIWTQCLYKIDEEFINRIVN